MRDVRRRGVALHITSPLHRSIHEMLHIGGNRSVDQCFPLRFFHRGLFGCLHGEDAVDWRFDLGEDGRAVVEVALEGCDVGESGERLCFWGGEGTCEGFDGELGCWGVGCDEKFQDGAALFAGCACDEDLEELVGLFLQFVGM